MKFAVTFAVLAFASQCLAVPTANGDEYKELIIDVLKFAQQQLAVHDPFKAHDVKGLKVKTQDLDLVLDQTNTLISKASTFTVDDVETDPKTLTASVKLSIPELVQSFDFNVAGTGFGKQLSGSGSASIRLQGFKQSIAAEFVNPDTSFQIKSLKLEYDFSELVVSENGLKISGFTDAQVKEFVSQKFVEFVKDNKATVEASVAEAAVMKLNPLMAGKTLKEVGDWIKGLIHH